MQEWKQDICILLCKFQWRGKTYQKKGASEELKKSGSPLSPPMSNNSPETAIKRNCQLAVIPSPPPSKGREKLNLFQEAGQMV